ncbi:prepilin-type N-terminal cleavage/methylation domain-containing protein [bacterium]|nr:prepilin-type N-terminal cleavage/methylation domain-containing protein [bacterium]
MRRASFIQHGFTVTELMVAVTISSVFTLGVMQTAISYTQTYYRDVVRTRVNQNLRSATNIIGMNTAQSGEFLPTTFPAIEVTNGTSGNSDTLIIRKGMLSAIPFLCKTLGSGAADRIYISSTTSGAPSGCVRTNVTTNYNALKTYRLANSSKPVKAFIYDISSKVGEFFTYNGETDTGTEYYLTRTSGVWANTYSTTSTSIYLVEELKFNRASDLLQMIKNDDSTNALGVMFGITDFQVSIGKTDNTQVTSFPRTTEWNQIKYIDMTLTASESGMKKTYTKSETIRVYPRNILAH